MNGQVEKLDFLMQALVRTSRLESGILAIRKQQESLYETLASALGGILFTAEAKDILWAVRYCGKEPLIQRIKSE